MKFNKVTSTKAVDALVTGAEAAVGFAASNYGVKAVGSLVDNKWLQKGIVAGLGILGAIAVPNNHVKALSAGIVAKQAYDVIQELVQDHASGVELLTDAFEVNPAPVQTPEAMNALRSALAGRGLGNPSGKFKMGSPLRTAGGFVAG